MDDEYRDLERLAKHDDASAVALLRVLRQRRGVGKSYSVAKGSTYAEGLWNLRDSFVGDNVLIQPSIEINGERLLRFLSLKENLVARVEDFNTLNNLDKSVRSLDERTVLWRSYLDSCTGILYRKKSKDFKIIPVSSDLMKLERNFRELFVSGLDYNAVDGIPLNSSRGIYGKLLNDEQFLAHEAWRAVFEADKSKDDELFMKEYRKVWKEVFRLLCGEVPEWGMDFHVIDFHVSPYTDENVLQALFVSDFGGSGASGCCSLDYYCRFARAAQI